MHVSGNQQGSNTILLVKSREAAVIEPFKKESQLSWNWLKTCFGLA